MSPRPKGFAVTGSEAAQEAGKKGGKAAKVRPTKWSPFQAVMMSRKAVEAKRRKAAARKEEEARLLSVEPGVGDE